MVDGWVGGKGGGGGVGGGCRRGGGDPHLEGGWVLGGWVLEIRTRRVLRGCCLIYVLVGRKDGRGGCGLCQCLAAV